MNYVSIGDMAQAFQMRRHNVELQKHLTRLTEEMTTGVKADMAEAVSGDFRALAGIDRSLETLEAYATATSEAELFASSLQAALGVAADIASDLGPALLGSATSASPTLISTAAADVRQKFGAVVSALNTQVADRYLLSGTATDQRPVADAEAILAALTTATAGQTTASGIEAAVTAWFDAPAGGGGYLDLAYNGSSAPLAPFQIGPGTTATIDLTAADGGLRDLLKGLALGALVDTGALAGNDAGRTQLIKSAGKGLTASGTALAGLRARVGTAEAQIADTATRNSAEASALKIARNGIIAADPYETASALEAVQTQIETLYTLTARLSRLSLTDYL